MIKYNNSNINDWNFDDSNIVKVYHNGAVCYYKIITSGGTSGQTPCFAVVSNISQYSDREFEDVFNLADEKWYKLNNLSAYEEYGVYGSGRNITYYNGKLTIDNGYEYQYSGNTWVNLGEVSGSTNAYRYWMWRSVGEIVGTPSNFIQFSEFDLVVNGSDVSLSYISAAPSGVTTGGTNETADKLFDNDTSTKFCADFSSYLNTNYILFDAQSAITPTAFAMTTANDNSQFGRYPTSWVLLGSNTSTTNWNDGSWNLVLSGTCGNEMYVDYTRFDYPIIYDYSQLYLTLQALESGTIGFSNGTVDYSTDSGSTWNTLTQGDTISVNQGDEVLFKKSVTVPDMYTGIGTFTSSCRFNVYGNIMSMQEGDNFATATTIANYEFYFKRLFAESKVVSAENMVLPATTLRNFCYNELFKDATYLTTPPKVFPATALTQDCYSHSYNGCTSLTKSPVLPALTAARGSFAYMFVNCTSLTAITCLATDISAIYATTDWVDGVQTNSGTFYKNPNASWSIGNSGIPSNWNVEDYVEPSPFVYPVYYDEIQDPPNNLSFSSMTEAESYQCPWVGMKATIDGSGYTFSGDSQSGYEWVHNSSRLPVGYTEVQYIENTDYASLEINYHPNQDTRVVTTMQAVQTNENSYGRFLGSGHWNCEDGTHGWQFDYEENPTGQLHISWGAVCGWRTYNVYGDYNVHTYDWNKNEFYIDNTLIASTTYQNFTCESNLGIFAQILGTGAPPSIYGDGNKEYLRGKLYDFKIYDDGALVADLVPCTNPNNVTGVYDIVNNVFYTAVNQGYYFVAGPTV